MVNQIKWNPVGELNQIVSFKCYAQEQFPLSLWWGGYLQILIAFWGREKLTIYFS